MYFSCVEFNMRRFLDIGACSLHRKINVCVSTSKLIPNRPAKNILRNLALVFSKDKLHQSYPIIARKQLNYCTHSARFSSATRTKNT
uniref:Putative ovule protein n=1 Tax=Solanum chacoense TaxID=4108 RepID=A0A0V0HAS6_SOLCH